jgi:two-component system, LytTR family, response regulator
MRALIVDDEPWARRGVALRLQRLPGIQIVGECGDGYSAIKAILERSPDVVFLDVQMPGIDGFELLEALPMERLPGVVFLTAYEKHALRAFEVHALDYLLKPLDDARFAAAVTRVRKLVDAGLGTAVPAPVRQPLEHRLGGYVSRFAVRTASQIRIVRVEDLEWVAACGNYVELHAGEGTFLLRETMETLSQKLDPSQFLRIHRSRIVRRASIRALRLIDNREYLVKLADGSEHRSSRTHADGLEEWMWPGR